MLYSGDRPNPGLRSFVEAHLAAHPFRPARDAYRVEEFTRPIETTKNSPVYSMHPYHLGKKPHDAVEAYVRHYTSEGDLVLDPFCGSGGTALAALLNGRKAVAIDASPAATFITRFYISRTDPEDLARRFEDMCVKVREDMERLYATRCHRCGGPAHVHYVIYSNVYRCSGCSRPVSLYEASQSPASGCPHCLAESGEHRSIGPFLDICGYEPVAVNFSCRGTCKPRRMTRSISGPQEERKAFHEIDAARIKELESTPIPYGYPRQFMMNVAGPALPWGDEWRPSRDFRTIPGLFTHANLWAIAALMHAAGDDPDLRAIITSGMFAVSRKAQHLDRGGGYIPGTWALPPMSKQRNVLDSLKKVFHRTLKAKRLLAERLRRNEAIISTQSATSLAAIPACSVDYIFTDPPYGGAVQYAELNFVWEAWLGLNTGWHRDEIIVNKTRGKTLEEWASLMRQAVAECFRVLKPGRWLSLCYHDSSLTTWRHVQEIMSDAGFVVGDLDRALSIDTGSHTYNQRVSEKVVKRDLVINFRKPSRSEKHKRAMQPAGTSQPCAKPAVNIIAEYLLSHPGASKDRIYDHLVSVMIRSGRVEEHDFEKSLSQVAVRAEDGSNRWFAR